MGPDQSAGVGLGSVAARGPRLVIFDFDGTLADSFPWFAAELPAVARCWGFRPVAPGEDVALRRLDASAIFRHLGVPDWKLPLITLDLRRRMARDIRQIRPFAGVGAMLEGLAAAGHGLALLSSNSEANIARVLGPRLHGLFAVRECGVALGGKAARLRRLLRRSGADPARAIFIGDELRDIAAARAVGIAAGVVTWGYNSAEVLRGQGPDLVFEQVGEILPRLRP